MSIDQMPSKENSLLKEWTLDPNFPDQMRFLDVNIHLKYPDVDSLLEFEPQERKRLIAQDHREKFNKLIQLNLFQDYERIGTTKRPTGVKTKIPFSALAEIQKLDFVDIFTEKVDGAKKKKQRKQSVFYCVKMTVIAQIEGVNSGLEQVDDQYVLIKAKSHDDAYAKIEKQKDEYEVRYLNSDGRFVRWKIESYDDCYQTDIKSFKDLKDPMGSEVYSKYRTRRMNPDNVWDGK